MRLRKLLLVNMYVNWATMLVLALLLGYLYFSNDFPAFGMVIMWFGWWWAVAGMVFCALSLYFAWRKHLLKLWGLSCVMSALSLTSIIFLVTAFD